MILDNVSRFKSFMAKTQLLMTQADQQMDFFNPWNQRTKHKKIIPDENPKHPNLSSMNITRSQTFSVMRTTKTQQPHRSPPKVECTVNVVSLKFPKQLTSKLKLQKPIIHKKSRLRIDMEETPSQLPNVNHFQRTTTSMHKSYKNIKRKTSLNSLSQLKYQNNSQQMNISQLNRLVSKEVFYKLSKLKKHSDYLS